MFVGTFRESLGKGIDLPIHELLSEHLLAEVANLFLLQSSRAG